MDIERLDGNGLSSGFGLAAAPNLDVVRNPSLGGKFYFARLGVHTVIPLSHKLVPVDRSPLSLSSRLPERRLDIYLGRFSAVDFLNYNSVGTDDHHQFLNWCIDNDGTYDYPADTRGYTNGGMVAYQSPHLAVRFLEAMLPTTANGDALNWNLTQSHSESYELERRYELIPDRPGTLRFLAFDNHGNLGNYQAAINNYLEGFTTTPNVTATERQGTCKYGFGFNCEQTVMNGITAFGRIGWNEGRHETYTYTECNSTYVLGTSIQGTHWKRATDKFGLALVSNGISKQHAQYLALGGLGFELGDGALTYGREKVIEMYYTCHLWKGLYVSPDIQLDKDPGYNRARGPLSIFGIRAHIDY